MSTSSVDIVDQWAAVTEEIQRGDNGAIEARNGLDHMTGSGEASDIDIDDVGNAGDGVDEAAAIAIAIDDANPTTTNEAAKANPLFERLHPIGWAAAILAAMAVIATILDADLLIGRMPWWMWVLTLAAIAIATAPQVLHRVRLGIERISTLTGYVAFVLAWLVFFIQVFNVVTRYSNDWFDADILFGQTVSMAWMGFGLLFLLGANYGVKAAVNPRVDFWWAEWSNKRKAWLDFIMHSLFFFPFLLLGIRVLLPYAKISLGFRPFANDGMGEWPSGWRVWETWEQSVNAGELPVGPIQAFLLVGFVLWAAQIFAEMIKTGFIIAGRNDLADIAAADAPVRVE